MSDKYAKNYYAISPLVNPTGPSQGTESTFEYKVTVTQSGNYSLTAEVVTANEYQRLNVMVVVVNGIISDDDDDDNDIATTTAIQMPFTLGEWQTSQPVMLLLESGENTLRFWRDKPPQYGLVIKEFTLVPAA